MVALSVDDPSRSASLVAQLSLPFPVLCDPGRKVIEAWGLCNREEKGGIAHPAVFVLDHESRVRYLSVDRVGSRIGADDVLAFVRGSLAVPSARTRVRPSLRDFALSLGNAIRRGFVTPRT